MLGQPKKKGGPLDRQGAHEGLCHRPLLTVLFDAGSACSLSPCFVCVVCRVRQFTARIQLQTRSRDKSSHAGRRLGTIQAAMKDSTQAFVEVASLLEQGV